MMAWCYKNKFNKVSQSRDYLVHLGKYPAMTRCTKCEVQLGMNCKDGRRDSNYSQWNKVHPPVGTKTFIIFENVKHYKACYFKHFMILLLDES